MKSLFKNRRRTSARRGVAMAEVAFCLPLLFMVALATVEICSAVFLKETLSIAGYEGARVAVKRRATHDQALAMVNNVLQARGIQNSTVQIVPDDFTTLDALDPITITVSAPVANNSAYISTYFYGKTVSSTVVMVREFDD